MAVPGEVFEEVAPDDPRVVPLYRAQRRVGAEALGIAVTEPTTASEGLSPPDGTLLLGKIDDEPVAIGGVRGLDGPIAEIKAMFVVPAFRGRGISRRLLGRLESIAVARGCQAVRLDTLEALAAAVSLYESAGYVPVPDYNASPYADRWYERRLG